MSAPHSDLFKLSYIIITIIFWYWSLNALLTIILNFSKIKYMITLIKVSMEFIIHNMEIILVPLILFIAELMVVILWVLSSM